MDSMNEDKRTASTDEGTDAEQLRALGYTQRFDRTMSFWQNFALGFTYLSPVVGVYSIFAYGLATGGPPMVWAYLLAGMGQMLVCLVFGEVVSQFPIAGGVYPWGRRLVGKKWAWIVGWIYGWALFTTIAGSAVGAGPFLTALLGIDPSPAVNAVTALVLVLIATLLNLAGTKLLARVAMFGFICELVGAIYVGAHVLLFHRYHSLGIIFDTYGIGHGGSYLPAFLAASLVGAFTCYGFEACGDLAEETENAGTAIPRSMRVTIYIGVGASVFVAVALLLAVPDIGAVIAGKDTNPLITVLRSAFGPIGSRLVVAIVMVSFLSCLLSLQAAVSRLIYAYARDKMIVGSEALGRLSPSTHVPTSALMVAGAVPAMIVCLGYFMENAVTTIIGFATGGIYIAFQMIVAGALFARIRGWQPNGRFALGRWGYVVNIAALVYGVSVIVNILWPRVESDMWYMHYSMLLTAAFIIICGLFYMTAGRPYDKGISPAGDAWQMAPTKKAS
jgi:amino acid transporter